MTKEEALEKLNNHEVITEEMAQLLDIHPDFIGATKEEVEDFLGIEDK